MKHTIYLLLIFLLAAGSGCKKTPWGSPAGAETETSGEKTLRAPPRSRDAIQTIEIQLLGEDKLSETEIDLGVVDGWRFEFTGPDTAFVHFTDGTSGSIWQQFPKKRNQKMRFTGPAGERVVILVYPPIGWTPSATPLPSAVKGSRSSPFRPDNSIPEIKDPRLPPQSKVLEKQKN